MTRRQPPRDAAIEQEVRRRLADALSSAGVGGERVNIEVLYFLPPDFVDAYTTLFHRALGTLSGVSYGDGENEEIRRTKAKQLPLARRGKGAIGRSYKEHWFVRDEQALKTKTRIDRELRKLSGKMKAYMRGGEREKIRSRCGGCGKYLEAGTGWRWCPWCGWDIQADEGRHADDG